MKLGIATLRQQQEQRQTGDLVALAVVGGQSGRGQLVEGLQLLDVAGEGVGVSGADGEQGSLLVGFAGEGEEGGRRFGGGGEGVELEEGELGFGEEGVCVGVAHGGGVLELGDDLGEGAFGHGCG